MRSELIFVDEGERERSESWTGDNVVHNSNSSRLVKVVWLGRKGIKDRVIRLNHSNGLEFYGSFILWKLSFSNIPQGRERFPQPSFTTSLATTTEGDNS